MAKFSETSRLRLSTCHPALRDLFETAIEEYDLSIIEGHRGQEAQNAAVAAGNSQTPWPRGKHNQLPSRAVDAGPYPIKFPEWPSMPPENATRAQWTMYRNALMEAHRMTCRWYYYGGYMLGLAKGKGIRVRWGNDWDRDEDFWNHKLADMPHIELLDDDAPAVPRPEEIA